MYKIINIDGKDYKQEFTVEASLYNDCTERLIDFMFATATAQAESEVAQNANEEEREKRYKESLKAGIGGIATLPTLAMTLWYAGFMEYHGADGIDDNSVKTMRDAKILYKKYYAEHPEESSYYDIVGMCIEQMDKDGFFQRIGLDKMIETPSPKEPQDRRKKAKATPKS